MIKIKNIISFLVSVVIIVLIVLNANTLLDIVKDFNFFEKTIEIPDSNEWKKDYDLMYFKKSDNFIPNNYDELVQVFFTALDNGWKEFTFYCGDEYVDCLDDVTSISYDVKFLSEMNNFVHPYNSFSTIKTIYYDNGEITISVDKLYTDEEILKIDADIDKIMNDNLNDNMSIKDKIKAMHDYIINNTKYDKERAEFDQSSYDSARIQGVLYDHYAICSAYTDTMAVVLSKLGVMNYKISSNEHVWNAVYLDEGWYHLDLTWDDPITTSGRDVLDHSFFLIDDDKLTKLDMNAAKRDHVYNRSIYLEFNS